MKLFFPDGEHPQVLIGQGVLQVGNGADVTIALVSPGIAERHAELIRAGDVLTLRALEGAVSVNGEALVAGGEKLIKPGDLIGFSAIQVRVVEVEKAGIAPAARPAPVDDNGATRVRMAVPRFVLRGVSGAAFGKTYPVSTTQVIGRQADCDIAIPSEEISRRHAQVRPTPAGLQVEDLGSSNGTFINGKRVQEGLLAPGEELRLDNIRFLLVAPGVEIPSVSRLAKGNEPAPQKSGSAVGWIVATIAALAAAGAAAYFLF
ncbi:FHA domain-containing protein [Xanthomonadaceae bacterium JHOS43]|nr:FHA domain-containing protein [Xanthomonadaceae bacterium JHOS43]MCX7562757.1 FHA domain-containing protein [Xanthomonadaceae bacterium XH05]